MIAEILSVGTELLLGQIVNSDAQFLSRRLSGLGVTVYRHVTVGDNPARVKEALRQALSRSDLVITTGGLGPTEDDLTKEMVAEELGLEMALHQPSLDAIERFFAGTGRKMGDNNRKQAYFPVGAHILPNRRGTAPGCVVEAGGKRVAVLPGPPFELIDMYEQQLEPYLASLSDREFHSTFLRVVGIGESEVENRLRDLFHSDNPTLALYCSPGEVQARITTSCPIGGEYVSVLAPVEREIRARLGDAVYAAGLEQSMPKTVLELLISRGKTLAVAESCTGGMLASQIVDCPGASGALLEGFITYTDEAKVRALGVSRETLGAHGAVSEPCAREMAEGARRASGADYALATTGFAGPDGGTAEAPVGTIYVALADADGVVVKRLSLRSDRARNRSVTCLQALNLLRLRLSAKGNG